MSERVELTYKLTAIDLQEVRKYLRSDKTPRKITRGDIAASILFLCVILVFSFLAGRSSILESLAITVFAIIGFVIFSCVLSWLLRITLVPLGDWALNRSIEKKIRKDSYIPPTKYIFDENSVTITEEDELKAVDWNFFSEVREYPEGYLLLSEEGQIQIIVPKRVFRDRNEQSNFRNLTRLKLGLNAKINLLL